MQFVVCTQNVNRAARNIKAVQETSISIVGFSVWTEKIVITYNAFALERIEAGTQYSLNDWMQFEIKIAKGWLVGCLRLQYVFLNRCSEFWYNLVYFHFDTNANKKGILELQK